MTGQQSFFEGTQPLKIKKPIRLVELFAGIGAQAKALERLGVPFEHYRICEWDQHAVTSYNAIHGTEFKTSDIQKIHADDLAIVDTERFCYIMTYSFPCTDLSIAGKQAGMSKGSGTRSGFLWEVERLLTEMTERPQILLMENVPMVISEKYMSDFAQWIAFLDDLGYMSKYQILNAKDYGVPQNRARCFMVSWLGDFFYDFPEPVPLETQFCDLLEPEVDERYYLTNQECEMYDRHYRRHKELGHGFGWSPIPCGEAASTHTHTHTHGGRSAQRSSQNREQGRIAYSSRCLCIGRSLQKGFESWNRIYSPFGIAPTVTCRVDGKLVETAV